MRSPIKANSWLWPIITVREREASALILAAVLLTGVIPRRAAAIAWMCSGVVPQQPPIILAPAWRKRSACSAISSGESGKNVFPSTNTGSPALGSTERKISLKRPISAITGKRSWAPPEQLAPMASGLKASRMIRAVFASVPIMVRPPLSKLIWAITGSPEQLWAAITAARISPISVMVSIEIRSAPAFSQAVICWA